MGNDGRGTSRQCGANCRCVNCHYRQLAKREQGYFDAAHDLLERLADLIAEYPSIWHRGDGKGGYLAVSLVNALEERGIRHDGWTPYQPRPEVLVLAQRDGWDCSYCGVTLQGCPDRPHPHVDHVMPKSRGGSDDLANKVLACGPCNTSKNARTPDEWIAARKVKG